MSFLKSDGSRIEAKFTEKINSVSIFGQKYFNLGMATVSTKNQYNAAYSSALLYDGIADTSTFWWGETSVNWGETIRNWIKLKFKSGKIAKGFRWYIPNSTYYPKTFVVSGSNDNSSWTQLSDELTGTSDVGWQEFLFANEQSYIYYKIEIKAVNSSRIYISELELLLSYGNETSFIVTVPEYEYVPNGPIIQTKKAVKSVINKVADDHAIEIIMEDTERFCSSAGDIAIDYDSSIGNLSGAGGPVESFHVSFTPIGLVSKPHQKQIEHIKVLASCAGTLKTVTYCNTKGDENIALTAMASGILTNISDL